MSIDKADKTISDYLKKKLGRDVKIIRLKKNRGRLDWRCRGFRGQRVHKIIGLGYQGSGQEYLCDLIEQRVRSGGVQAEKRKRRR